MNKTYQGLSSQEVKDKLNQYGLNQIKKAKKINPVKILLNQFKSPLVLILIVAALISLGVNYYQGKDYIDSILIAIIVLASAIAGFVQDYKAEQAIKALKKMASPTANVIRDGQEQEVKAKHIVPEDILILEGGDVIPADAEILEGKAQINEAVLTGESKAVRKAENDYIYSSCSISSGKLKAKVYKTGMETKVGKIAQEMQDIQEAKTPFQNHMQKFSNKLVIFTGAIILITFIAGVGKFGIIRSGLIAVSLAVAAIPEGLPAVITLALSLGAKSMVKQKALIRKLAITESIGSINTICTDKTGTLTEGKMKVTNLWTLNKYKKVLNLSYKCASFCNNAKKIQEKRKKKWSGDETEIALKKYTLSKTKTKEAKILDEIPFTSKRKMMSTQVKMNNNKYVFSKGAPEVLLEKCQYTQENNEIKNIDKETKQKILNKNTELASKGYRVLALAYKSSDQLNEDNLVFLSLIYLSDPVRRGVKQSVKECQQAGIRAIMITGDNPLTAKSIAKKVNIETDKVYTGEDIEKLDEEEIREVLTQDNNIFARTSPFHKLKILNALDELNKVVAMTGDGVNDALALKKSDVGVAMGIKGTEVSKQASDIILLNDHFATIKNAIKEGRRIFDNIRKFINYLLTCNLAEVIVILVATITLPFVALYPVQILWINLITDGLVALALSVDKAKPNIMSRPPRDRQEGIINKKLAILMSGNGILMAIFLLILFFFSLNVIDKSQATARTLLFTGFILFEFVRLGVIKYHEKLKSLKDWFANKFLIYSLLVSLALQFVIIYTPLNDYFKIIPLNLSEWAILLGFTILGFMASIFFTKLIQIWFKKKNSDK